MDVLEFAVRELDRRENIQLGEDADYADLVWAFATYFGEEEAKELENSYINAKVREINASH